MNEPPVLVLAFNRPENVKNLFKRLKILKPRNLLIAVDGPRKNNPSDFEKVQKVQKLISEINWDSKVQTLFRETNLGIRFAVPTAVNWAIEKFGSVVVIEDDVLPGKDFFEFMNFTLDKFKDEKEIGHISGYNQVPNNFITNRNNLFRFSNYPESYAWGTWERAWDFYSDEIQPIDKFFFECKWSRIVWQNYFDLAKKDLISTWAFRWINALWNNNLMCVSPNVNLVDYVGQSEGTHTRRKPRAPELEIESINQLSLVAPSEIDQISDHWTKKHIFHESPYGAVEIKITKYILNILKRFSR